MAMGFGLSVITDPAQAQTPGTFVWGGGYGHSWFVDGTKGLSVVVLTNTALEGMAGQLPLQVRDAIYAAL